MEKFIPVLKKTRLFSNVEERQIISMLSCLQAHLRTYGKGEYVCRQGEVPRNLMILLDGTLHIQREDYWGNLSIIQRIDEGEMFGEVYAAPDSGPLLNDVVAVEESVVAFFDVQRILTVCSSACEFHTRVIQNLFFAISSKNRSLMQKLGHMEKRTTREKLISYLSEEAEKQGSGSFSIPFNRQQMADFLSVDRSAMSKELCKMRDEGLLSFEKNRFVLR